MITFKMLNDVDKKQHLKRSVDSAKNPAVNRADSISFVLYSYDHSKLDKAAKDIVYTALSSGATVSGPVAMPSQTTVLCVNRSPHVYNRAKDHFKRTTHARYIKVFNYRDVASTLSNLELPVGVYVVPRGPRQRMKESLKHQMKEGA
jgi:small subunit ribosomal protein S10